MDRERKDANIQIGCRLREVRKNMNLKKSEIAREINVSDEHYRKLESGFTGLSVDKMLILYHKYGVDPAYLITGSCSNSVGFDLEYYIANSSREQKNEFFTHVLAYIGKIIKN